jgi:hypothetical protein
VGAFDREAFDQAAFDKERLEIAVDFDDEKKWIPAEIVIEGAVKFWRDFFFRRARAVQGQLADVVTSAFHRLQVSRAPRSIFRRPCCHELADAFANRDCSRLFSVRSESAAALAWTSG